MNQNNQTVYVGMSGGVDSSVSAALLKQATPNNFEKLFGRPTPKGFSGYNVVGVFIKAWEPFDYAQGKPIVCGWRDERRDAMRVAAHLDIPFLTLDLSKEYKEMVVDYMIAEYKAGRTPNPDVMCNKAIKFGAFFKRAMADGADFVATGHYARIRNVKCQMSKVKSNTENTEYEMLAGVDKNKDQTYFLWTLKQDRLSHTLFPVGDLEKSDVRKLAAKFGLPNSEKKDSQGVCFVGQLDVKEFLKEFIEEKPGDVLDLKGQVIGRHEGVLFYTLGERRGFMVFKKSPDEKPLYVIAKDLRANSITVGTEQELKKNMEKTVSIAECNWTISEPEFAKLYGARVHYRQPLQNCRLEKTSHGKFSVRFDEPQTAASGQSLVLYDGEICLGGGIIK